MSNPHLIRTICIVAFVLDSLAGLYGFLLFRYPQAWVTLYARVSQKELIQFNTASIRRLGTLVLIIVPFLLLGDLVMYFLVGWK